jgi:hypothetical protein
MTRELRALQTALGHLTTALGRSPEADRARIASDALMRLLRATDKRIEAIETKLARVKA